jgi:hypothetical protein
MTQSRTAGFVAERRRDHRHWRVVTLRILAECGMEYREAVVSHSPGLPRSGNPGTQWRVHSARTPTGFRRSLAPP